MKKTLGKYVSRAVVVPTLLLGVTLGAIAMSVSVSGGVSHTALAADGGSGVVTAQDQSASVTENSSVIISATDFSTGYSDSDPNPSLTCCTVQIVDGNGPNDGTITADTDGDGGYAYQPDSGYTGTDSFQFTLTDSDGNVSDPATMNLDVTPLLTAGNATYVSNTNNTLSLPPGTLLNGSTDAASDAPTSCCTAQLDSQASDGAVDVDSNGSFSYTPVSGFSGTDSFTFGVSDADGDVSAPATVTVDVGKNTKTSTTIITDNPPATEPKDPVTFVAEVLFPNGQSSPKFGNVSFTWYKTAGAKGGGPKSGSLGTSSLSDGEATITTKNQLPSSTVDGSIRVTATYSGTSTAAASYSEISYFSLPKCSEAAWPSNVQGDPDVASNGSNTPTGYYIGESDGWYQFYTSTVNAPTNFTGTITSNGLILDASALKDKSGQSFKVTGDDKLTYEFHDGANGLNGFSFYAGCGSSLRIRLTINGKAATTRQIFLGVNEHHGTTPLVIKRAA